MLPKIDEDEFRAVARIVAKFNPHSPDVEFLLSRMRSDAAMIAREEAGYMSSRGYVLSLFKHPGGGLGVKASVAHYILSD